MAQLLRTFVEIALWRKGPQHLPASGRLALWVLALYVACSFVKVRLLTADLRQLAVVIGVDVLMLLGWCWAVLAFFERRQRFVQTASAALGVGVVLVVLDICVLSAYLALGWHEGVLIAWLRVRLLVVALLLGRIFMHALDRGLITGMGLTIAIIYSTEAVAQGVLLRLGSS